MFVQLFDELLTAAGAGIRGVCKHLEKPAHLAQVVALD
jgi:hypothetical protein